MCVIYMCCTMNYSVKGLEFVDFWQNITTWWLTGYRKGMSKVQSEIFILMYVSMYTSTFSLMYKTYTIGNGVGVCDNKIWIFVNVQNLCLFVYHGNVWHWQNVDMYTVCKVTGLKYLIHLWKCTYWYHWMAPNQMSKGIKCLPHVAMNVGTCCTAPKGQLQLNAKCWSNRYKWLE